MHPSNKSLYTYKDNCTLLKFTLASPQFVHIAVMLVQLHDCTAEFTKIYKKTCNAMEVKSHAFRVSIILYNLCSYFIMLI